MPDPLDLDAIRASVAAATEGPWHSDPAQPGRWSMTRPSAALLGIPIHVSTALPIYPGHREDARRTVRHGLRRWVEYIGEDVGPKPGEPAHVLLVDLVTGATAAFVSAENGRPSE